MADEDIAGRDVAVHDAGALQTGHRDGEFAGEFVAPVPGDPLPASIGAQPPEIFGSAVVGTWDHAGKVGDDVEAVDLHAAEPTEGYAVEIFAPPGEPHVDEQSRSLAALPDFGAKDFEECRNVFGCVGLLDFEIGLEAIGFGATARPAGRLLGHADDGVGAVTRLGHQRVTVDLLQLAGGDRIAHSLSPADSRSAGLGCAAGLPCVWVSCVSGAGFAAGLSGFAVASARGEGAAAASAGAAWASDGAAAGAASRAGSAIRAFAMRRRRSHSAMRSKRRRPSRAIIRAAT